MRTDLLAEILAEARDLPLVPLKGVSEYQGAGPEMIRLVDAELGENESLQVLIGNNPLQVMYDNHKHHWAFMATVFGISGYELLARTVPWVYRSYHSHGFSYDYFPVELNAWKRAIATYISEKSAGQILMIYDWILDKHDQMIELAELEDAGELPISESWLEDKDTFKRSLLEGNFTSCMDIAHAYINESARLKDFYLHIIQPSMYEIGLMWEKAEISVAQEHLASAVVSRILACVAGEVSHIPKEKGKAVITAAPGEFHEIGAWMVSDLLEQDGWQVSYLGANTPDQDLINLLEESLPDLLVLSVTMPFNLDRAKAIVAAVRENSIHRSMRILVGGRVFVDNPELEKVVGADGLAANLDEALRITRSWM